MATIMGLCWTTAEELMRDIDLDPLYVRQLGVLGGEDNHTYPYLILMFTGKITIGINLGNGCAGQGGLGLGRLEKTRVNEDAAPPESSPKEPLE
ncbi:MAG: hypothetical protein RDU20_03965 [Desulfomonilaceae bacterium]|nr:hypothetical protein [Desulfomonilaceae bacterium]